MSTFTPIPAFIADRAPWLGPDDEIQLFIKMRDDQDATAREELVASLQRFVYSIANGLAGYGLPIEDLASSGNIGLITALKFSLIA